MTKKVTTAVFPVAGLGTRFLPITKAAPKEMLPIIDKPIIQYAVEEAVAAGIKKLIFITSSNKHALEDYFDTNYELESILEQRAKLEILSTVKNIIPDNISISYMRQHSPRGLGDAVLCASPLIQEEYFAVLLPDDIIDCGNNSCIDHLIKAHGQTGGSILAVETIKNEDIPKYGIIKPSTEGNKITQVVEKPKIEDAPSNQAIIGRYVLNKKIFNHLKNTKQDLNSEVQLTHAINSMLENEPTYSYAIEGKRYDCGSKQGYLEAVTAFALRHPELKTNYLAYLKETYEQATTKTST